MPNTNNLATNFQMRQLMQLGIRKNIVINMTYDEAEEYLSGRKSYVPQTKKNKGKALNENKS